MRFAPRIRPGGHVLDLAAGSGRNSRALLRLGHRVTALDIDVSSLQDLGGHASVELIEADLEKGEWPFGERHFDAIVVTNYLHRPLFPALAAALARGGVLIYETFAVGNEAYGRPANPAFLLREGELLHVYANRLNVIAYEHVLETEPRPAVRQRICAELPHDAAKTPERHADTSNDTESE